MNHRIPRAIGTVAILLVILMTTSALWFGMQPTAWFLLCMKAITMLRGYSLLAIGIAIMILVLTVEWQAILNDRRLAHMSIAQVEFTHPRFPNRAETIITILFTIALTLLFFQFTSQVFAFAFVLSSSSSESYQSEQVFIFDYENDGDMDYVILNGGSDPYELYKNNGGGGFTESQFGMGGNAAHTTGQVFAGDIDGDGDVDVVSNDTIGVPIHQIAIYKNTSAATWPTSTITVTNERSGMILSDVDSDGDLDIVTTEASAAVTDAVYLNDGHGNFASANSTLPAANYLAAADLDSDGDQDLILGIAVTSKVYKNSGTGAFTSLGTFGFAANGSFPVLGDLDSDGDIDVLIARSTDGKVRPYLNDGAGAFSNGTEFGGVEDTRHVALGDVDNDGDFDAIIAGYDSAGTNAGNEVWLNNGSATFTQDGTPTEESDCTNGVAIGEFDGDESLDYVAANLGCSSGGAANRNYINDSTNGNPSPTPPISGLAVTLYSQYNRVTTLDSTGDVGSATSIKVPSDGLPIIVYQDTTNTQIKAIKCGNASCTSGNTTSTIGLYAGTPVTSVAVPSDGKPVITYNDGFLVVAKCGNSACSSGNTVTNVDSVTDVGYYSSVAIGADDLPVISYYDQGNFDLKVLKCGNAACTSGNTKTTVDSTGDVGQYTSITVPSDGFPVISYYDTTNGDLKVVKCSVASCATGSTLTTVDSTGNVGQYTSIAIYPTTGYPVISYYDVTNTNPKFVKCGNASCSSGNNIINLDNGVFGTNDGQYTSIAIGNDGLPVVTFYDASNTRLGFSKLTNAALTSSNGTSVQSGGSNGTHTSVAVPTSGHPIASYYDATNGNLKVVKCGNPSCSTIVGGVPQTDGGSPVHKIAWGSGTDTITPAKLLQYQVKLGTGSSANNIVSGATASPNYLSRVMPDGQARTMYIKNLTCNSALTYYWSVAVMDPGLKKSWSSQQTFALNSDCSMGTVSSGGTTSSSSPGGGLDHRIFDRKNEGGAVSLYSLPISFVNDLNGNGKIDGREKPIRFAGIPVTASGRTLAGIEVHTTLTLSDKGDTVFRLPIADAKGYTISVDEAALGGYRFTGPTTLTGVVVSPSGTGVSFGVKSRILLQYKPCLQIGEKLESETSGSDAWILLQRLEDPYGLRILRDVESKGQILSRRSFFTILARIACMPIETDPIRLKEGIRKHSSVALPLVDLPFSVTSGDSLLVHSLLAAGVDVTRETTIGPAADLNSPIARNEILRAVASLFPNETAAQKKTIESYMSSSASRASSLESEPVTSASSSVSSSLGSLMMSSSSFSSAASVASTGISTMQSSAASASSVQGGSASTATLTDGAALTISSAPGVALSSSEPLGVMQTLSSLSTTIQTSLETAIGLSSTSSSDAPVEPFVGLPTDIDVTDDSAPNYLALDGLKILPQSFRTMFGLDLGVTTQEASLLLVRTAFRLGRIPLLPNIEEENARSAAPPETFMSLLPSRLKLSCLEENTDRAMTVIFTDILPGDPLFTDVHSLLSLKIKNGDDKDQWLVAATRRPTELGVVKGQLKAVLDEPVSILETLRTLLVLSCTPPETRIESIQNGGKISSQGSAATRVARDMLSDLPRDASFASRVMYKSQDHQKEFDLSLLGYAPSLLRGESRSPAESFSVEEAGDVLASAILGIAVREKQITPQAAEGMANALATAIRKDLAGEDIDWRSEEILRKTPFTRDMLFRFLSRVIDSSPLASELSGEEMPSTGQLWWDRIK